MRCLRAEDLQRSTPSAAIVSLPQSDLDTCPGGLGLRVEVSTLRGPKR